MELNLTRNEKKLLNNIAKEKDEYKSTILPQSMALLAGGILLAAPCIFIINNISNLDKIVKTLGIYIVLIVIIGLVSLFISVYLTKSDIVKRNRHSSFGDTQNNEGGHYQNRLTSKKILFMLSGNFFEITSIAIQTPRNKLR